MKRISICLAVLIAAASLRAEIPDTLLTTNAFAASADVLRAYLQVQEQLHATQLAIERNRQDAEDVAARNTIALADRMSAIEKSLGEQRDRDTHANYTLLTIAGALALVGFLAFLASSFMQMRAMNRFAEALSHTQPSQLTLGHADPKLLGNGASEANTRLIGTIERLEKRIRELESGKRQSPVLEVVGGNGHTKTSATGNQIEVLLAKGQSLLSLDQADAAAAMFDEALALDPNHTEALIKKGAALEKLSRLDEAVACYDRAIAADKTVTIAYLYKGGVFNRMERYNEALACYEQALKTQEKAHAA